ncbi:MAG: hypothetical protein EA384_01900 [Spirochaetaceae bacterium]|nr:MAG: hypothetical protein EA384_01900 [Spirochaetaceae bacterium]
MRYSARSDGIIVHTGRIVALDTGGVVAATLDGILQRVGPMVDLIIRIVRRRLQGGAMSEFLQNDAAKQELIKSII